MPEAGPSPDAGPGDNLDLDLAPIEIDAAPLPPDPAFGADAAAHAGDAVGHAGDAAGHLGDQLADPSFWDSMFLWDMPILASTISGLLLGTVGMYLILARAAFVGAAVSNLAGLGVVLTIGLLGGAAHAATHLDGIARLVGIGVGVLGASLFLLPSRGRRTSTDAVLAIAVIGSSALTLVGAGFLTREYQHVRNTLYGDAVVASPGEVGIVAVLAVVILFVERRLRARWLFVLFDPETASAQGMSVRRWNALLGLMISLTIATTTSGVGALVAFAFSVLPPTIALMATRRIDRAFLLSGGLAVVAAAVGYYVAFQASLPVGPTMAAMLLIPLFGLGLVRAVKR